jgi:KDO2-lipid IV(A) lauroyltransferase
MFGTVKQPSIEMTKPKFQPAAFAQNLVARGLIGMALALPYRLRLWAMGTLMRRVIGPVAGYRRRALENLALIWPDLPPKQRIKIAEQVLDNAGRTLIENYSTRDFTARAARLAVAGPGYAALTRAQAEKRPVILVSGHFGNYEAARAALVAQGHIIGGLYRPMRNPYFNAHYVRTMEAFGGPVFPQGRVGTAGFVRHLKSGGLLVLLFDQHAGKDRIPFLGRPARTALSAAQLALRYKADLIPFYATREADGLSFRIELESPIPHSTPLQMTTDLTRSLEVRVTADPGQWFWIHKRWK